jgi:hypothetical protein
MTGKDKSRNGRHRPALRNAHNRNHTSTSILERHFCYCCPGIPCIFCLTWDRPIQRIEPRGGGGMKPHVKQVIVRLALGDLISAEFATWLIQRGGMRDA